MRDTTGNLTGRKTLATIFMDDLDLAKKLVDALVDDGAVHATGGMVWSKTKGNLMSTTDMIEAIRLCNVAGIRVERTDGGGFPTWKMFS